MRVGESLLGKLSPGTLGIAARSLDVDVRTLYNWRVEVRAGTQQKRIGRPKAPAIAHRNAMWKVGRELRRQGYPGWQAVAAGLGTSVPTRLIQLYVRLFKLCRERRRKARILFHQVRVEVLGREVIWGQDGTHVGRVSGGDTAIESQVIRDRGSLAIIGLHTGESADHKNVVDLLEATALKRASYPLVYGRDNGSLYHHPDVLAHLAEHHVIVLRSLPRTPEHNGATECTMKELKGATGLGKGCRLEIGLAQTKLADAATTLNKNRMRGSKGFKTSDEMDEKLARPNPSQRDLFYKVCRARMQAALLGQKSVRAGRMAEREEIFRTLEEFGFIKRTRGGNRYVSKSEIIL